MPRGTIVKNYGKGYYKVTIHGDLTRLKASLSQIEDKLAGLDFTIKEWKEKEYELWEKRKNLDKKLSDAQSAFNRGYINLAQLISVLQAYAVISREYWACQRHVASLESLYMSLTAKRLRWRQSTSPLLDGSEEMYIWCADYKVDLEIGTSVGIISFINELASGMVIHPHHSQGDYSHLPEGWVEDPSVWGSVWGKDSLYSPRRDGEFQPSIGAGDAQNFVNMALLPSWQRWMPRFRAGVIKKINLQYTPLYVDEDGYVHYTGAYQYYPKTADVLLDVGISSAQGLDINPGQKTKNYINLVGTQQGRNPKNEDVILSRLPLDYYCPQLPSLWYSTTAGLQFRPNEHVVVGFKNYDWNRARVIGYTHNPKFACYKVKIFRKGFPGYEVPREGDEVEVTDDSCVPIGENKWILHFQSVFNAEKLVVGGVVKPEIFAWDAIDGVAVEVQATITAVHILEGDKTGEEYCWGFLELTNKIGRFRGGGDPRLGIFSNQLIVNGQGSAAFRGVAVSPLEVMWATRYAQVGDFWYHERFASGGNYDSENGYWRLVLDSFLEGGFFLFAKDIPYTIKTQYPNKYKTDDFFNQGNVPCAGGSEGDLAARLDERQDSRGMGTGSVFMQNRRDYYAGRTPGGDFGDRILDDTSRIYEIHMPYWDVPIRRGLDPADTSSYFSGSFTRYHSVYSSVPFEAMFWLGAKSVSYQTAELRKIQTKSGARSRGEQIGTYKKDVWYSQSPVTFPIYDGGCNTELNSTDIIGYGSATHPEGVDPGDEDLIWGFSCDLGSVQKGVPAHEGVHFPGGGSRYLYPHYAGAKEEYPGCVSGTILAWNVTNISPGTVMSECVIAWYYYYDLYQGGDVYVAAYGSYASPVLAVKRADTEIDVRPVGVYWPEDPSDDNPLHREYTAQCGWVSRDGYALDSGIPDTLQINTRATPPAHDRPGGYTV